MIENIIKEHGGIKNIVFNYGHNYILIASLERLCLHLINILCKVSKSRAKQHHTSQLSDRCSAKLCPKILKAF